MSPRLTPGAPAHGCGWVPALFLAVAVVAGLLIYLAVSR